MRNQSANTLLTVPLITVWQTGLDPRPEDNLVRSHVDFRQVTERAIDNEGKYTGERGKSYTVERLPPIPFNMSVQVDIWTSNVDQKYQLEEQILTVMVPNFEIQNSDNPLDWSSKTMVTVEDVIHTNRAIPVGAEDDIEVMTLRLRIPMWLSPPAKVKQQKRIEQIITNIYNEDSLTELTQVPGVILDNNSGNRISQQITTLGNHVVQVDGNSITLLGPKGSLLDDNGNVYSWADMINQYGTLRPTVSQFSVVTTNNIEDIGIVGTVQYDMSNVNKLNWQINIDTLPANTLSPISAIINPMTSFPSNAGLPPATEGARYMITADIGHSSIWGSLIAKANDIIVYHSGAWVVSFASTGHTSTEYVLNSFNGKQLKWNGAEWVMAIDGNYGPGYWRLGI